MKENKSFGTVSPNLKAIFWKTKPNLFFQNISENAASSSDTKQPWLIPIIWSENIQSLKYRRLNTKKESLCVFLGELTIVDLTSAVI